MITRPSAFYISGPLMDQLNRGPVDWGGGAWGGNMSSEWSIASMKTTSTPFSESQKTHILFSRYGRFTIGTGNSMLAID